MSWKLSHVAPAEKLRLTICDSVTLVNEAHWQQVINGSNIYLSLPYLQAMEDALQSDTTFKYILFYNNDSKPVAVAAVQIMAFVDNGNQSIDLWCKIGDTVRKMITRFHDMHMMVCGNLFSCGENGFFFTDDITADEAYANLSAALRDIKLSGQDGKKVSVMLVKEFWPEKFDEGDKLMKHGFRDFMIDVNMVLELDKAWKSMEDYLDSMNSKFRTKAKGVFKKSSVIESRKLTLADIKKYAAEIEQLHHEVLQRADFNFGMLKGVAFQLLKQKLKTHFVMTGYFHEEKMVGFSTAFLFNGVLDANFVGLDYDYNHKHAIYQRMLYDFVDLAIASGCRELRLGRTAEEIKSCVGAKPVNMKLYVRHRNAITNKLISPVVSKIKPSAFELRKPFRAQAKA